MSSLITIKDSLSKLLAFIPGFRRSSDNMDGDYIVRNNIKHPYVHPQHLRDYLVTMGFAGERTDITATENMGLTFLLPYELNRKQQNEIIRYFEKKRREGRRNTAVEEDA